MVSMMMWMFSWLRKCDLMSKPCLAFVAFHLPVSKVKSVNLFVIPPRGRERERERERWREKQQPVYVSERIKPQK